MESTIEFSDFQKIEILAGKVLNVAEIEESDKLLKLEVDFGEHGKKQILSGIKEWFNPSDLKGNQYLFVTNIAPRKMMGIESQGMILAVDDGDAKVVLVSPLEEVENGSKVR